MHPGSGTPAKPGAALDASDRAATRASDRTRDRAATEARILDAVGAVLARDGFGAVGVNAIARQAGVDKVLIYRYFGGLPELLRAWGESGHFWPRVADLLGPDPQALLALPAEVRYVRFFEHFIDELRRRPLTLEILAAELTERNELTAILEAEREAWGEEAVRVLGGAEFAARPHLQGVTLLLVAGVQYLLLRSRRIRVFGGVDLHSEAGWLQLKQGIRSLAREAFAAAPA
jgi:AcrR family transcriptional regulator